MPSHRDYVIKDGKLVGRFEELYQDIEDPWGCLEHVSHLKNRLFLAALAHLALDRPSVLDVGCGLGALTACILNALQPRELFALDSAGTAIRKAASKYSGIHFFRHDMVALPVLPFEKGHFDLITMSETMWYVLPQIRRIVGELARICRKGGYLGILNRFFSSEEQAYGKEIIAAPRDLIDLLGEAGFLVQSHIDLDPGREHYAIIIAEAGGIAGSSK